jgi:hypothetical protein
VITYTAIQMEESAVVHAIVITQMRGRQRTHPAIEDTGENVIWQKWDGHRRCMQTQGSHKVIFVQSAASPSRGRGWQQTTIM